MERMLVAVFDSEAKAYEGARALQRLEDDGVISVYASRVVVKDNDGVTRVRSTEEAFPQATLGGTAAGSLIGLLGGPVGAALGAATGLALGATTDLTHARVGRDFVADVTNALAPGKAAVVAEIDEEVTAPADERLEALGGSVFRHELLDVENAEYDREIAAINAAIDRTADKFHKSNAERKQRLKARIDSLKEKLRHTRDRAKARR